MVSYLREKVGKAPTNVKKEELEGGRGIAGKEDTALL
jgi:hypothetical protein